MLGAIYGDKAGSTYEFEQLKDIKPIVAEKLILPNSFYSDDTIETIAVIDAIINNKDYEQSLREYILNNIEYKPNYTPYFKTSFSPGTIKWAKGIGRNDSIGNGAMMRISPVGYLFDSENDVIENARLATIPSHNSAEAIESATSIALMIFYFRNGLTKAEVFRKLNLLSKYEPFIKFNTTCKETLPNVLYAVLTSKDFEEAILKTVSMGGDTDTNAAIAGSIAEGLFGIPDSLIRDTNKYLPPGFVKKLEKGYRLVKSK